MKNLISLSKLSGLWWIIAFYFFSGQLVYASTVGVTASIPDTEPPSSPILIAPTDGALLSDNTPTFSWYESTDNMGVSHYAFYLNGTLRYNNLPLNGQNTSQYLLTYDSLNGIYSLTPKVSLADGAYTWRVVAVDYANLSSSSDTWDFRLDTLAPNFVLTKIGDTSVNISASNPNSVPSSAILIFQNDSTANEPMLIAQGEAHSAVKLTVTVPGDPSQIFTQNISSDGVYELKLGILPRDVDIRLDFIITDLAGHVSVLEKVYFRIPLHYWPPHTPTPTPSPPAPPDQVLTPTPVPTVISPPGGPPLTPVVGGGPTLAPTPTPTPTPTTGGGIIPIIPPKEIIHAGVGEVIELLPESTAQKIREFLSSSLWQVIARQFNLWLWLLFYLSAFTVLASKFISELSLLLLKRVFALLWPGLFASGENLVFEYRSTQPSPLVKVELLDKNQQVLDLHLSDRLGNFASFDVAELRQFKLAIKDPNFYHPIAEQKPSDLQFWQFYQGQTFDHEQYRDEPILVPTLQAAGQDRLPLVERIRIFYLYLLAYPLWWWLFLTFLALIFALRYASWANYLVLLFYLVMGAVLWWRRQHLSKHTTFAVKLGAEGRFSGNLVMSLFDAARHQARSAVVSCDLGQSLPLRHNLNTAILTTYAKGLGLAPTATAKSQLQLIFNESKQEIELQISKI